MGAETVRSMLQERSPTAARLSGGQPSHSHRDGGARRPLPSSWQVSSPSCRRGRAQVAGAASAESTAAPVGRVAQSIGHLQFRARLRVHQIEAGFQTGATGPVSPGPRPTESNPLPSALPRRPRRFSGRPGAVRFGPRPPFPAGSGPCPLPTAPCPPPPAAGPSSAPFGAVPVAPRREPFAAGSVRGCVRAFLPFPLSPPSDLVGAVV